MLGGLKTGAAATTVCHVLNPEYMMNEGLEMVLDNKSNSSSSGKDR